MQLKRWEIFYKKIRKKKMKQSKTSDIMSIILNKKVMKIEKNAINWRIL